MVQVDGVGEWHGLVRLKVVGERQFKCGVHGVRHMWGVV